MYICMYVRVVVQPFHLLVDAMETRRYDRPIKGPSRLCHRSGKKQTRCVLGFRPFFFLLHPAETRSPMLGMEVLRLRAHSITAVRGKQVLTYFLTTVTTSSKVHDLLTSIHTHKYVLNLHASSLADQPVTDPSSGTNGEMCLCPSVGGPWAARAYVCVDGCNGSRPTTGRARLGPESSANWTVESTYEYVPPARLTYFYLLPTTRRWSNYLLEVLRVLLHASRKRRRVERGRSAPAFFARLPMRGTDGQ